MPRGKVGDEVMKVRFGDGTFARIDAVASNRSEFIRDAVEAALGGSSDPVEKINTAEAVPAPKPVPPKKNSIVPLPVEMSMPPIVGVSDAQYDPVKTPVRGAPSGRQADAAAVLEVIRSKPMSSRQVEAKMGWLGLRYANAEKLLMSSGAVAVVDGHLVAT